MRGELLLWLLTKKVLGSGKKILCDGKTLTCDQRNWFRNGALQLQNYWAIGSTPNYYFRRKHPLSACYFLSCKYHSIRVLHTLEHIISDCLLMWNVCFCSCMMIEKWALTADYYSYVLLLLLISIPSGAWWKWTTTAPGSTTAVATWITPTSPASCSWLHWVAHTLPLSSLWLCTHSCMRGWAVTCAGFWCPVITVLGRTPTRLIKLFPLSSLQISFGWSTVRIDMSAVRQFQPLMPFSVPAFAATLFALGLALGTTIAVGMLFVIQVSFS